MRALLPPIVLVAVACLQIGLARTAGLSPWYGGGFGMFSSQDAAGHRHLHAFARHAGVLRELDFPPALRREARRVLALPTPGALRGLAARIGSEEDPDFGVPEALVLQVFATRFDPITLEPSGVLLRAVEVPVDAD